VRSLLAKTFNAAVDEGYITVSPLKQARIRFPKRNGKLWPGDPRVLTADEVEALARAAGNDRDALAIRLGAYVGLRAGEVGGLRVEDVDVKGCIVHVRRNSQRDGMGLPKTATSERSLRVPCSLTEDIARYVSEHESLADGTILHTSQRNPMTDQPLTKMVVEACERAGLRRVTFHDLRHTCASLLIAAKVLVGMLRETYRGR
jgi:integrase